MFSKTYNKILNWARNKNSSVILSIMSFAEAVFFPLPPDMFLIPMCLATPKKAIYFAGLTTIFSVLGGVLGYCLGIWAFDFFNFYMINLGYEQQILKVTEWFNDWGIWIIFIAGFSPIPYKIFTVMAGATYMPFLGFIFASLVGRGSRFFLLALVISLGGENLQKNIKKYIEYIGWSILLLLLFIIYLKFTPNNESLILEFTSLFIKVTS